MNVNDDVTRLLSILAQTNTTHLPPPAPPAPPPAPPAPHPRPQFPPPAVDPRLHGSSPFQQPPAPIPVTPADPKNITDWPAALKYVMNTIYRNEEIMAQVKKVRMFYGGECEGNGLMWGGCVFVDEEAPA